MGIMRKTLVNRLKDILDIPVQETYGYITKYKRESHTIKKTHISDAYCIANNLRFRLFDRVKYQDLDYFIFGRRKSGFFDIRNLDGQKVNKGSISCKKLKLIGMSTNYLTERRVAGAFLSHL